MGVEFAPIDTYRFNGIGRRYRQEKNYSYETVHMCTTTYHGKLYNLTLPAREYNQPNIQQSNTANL